VSTSKFSGVLKEIVERYPAVDVADHLEFELGIPRFKAETLAKRIEEKCLQNLPEKNVGSMQRLFKLQTEQAQKNRAFCVGCLSEKEFKTFVCWLLEEAGYPLQKDKPATEWGFEAVAEKGNEKILIQTVKAPSGCAVSECVVPITIQAKQRHDCVRAIVIATGDFTQKAVEEAQKADIELWNQDALNQKIVEANRNCTTQAQSRFPTYQGSLFDSLLKMEEGREFLIELKAEWRYELLLPGVRYPLLTFQIRDGAVTRCVFRIKYNEPVTEAEGEVLIGANDAGNRVGPSEAEAYALVVKYLEQFLE